MSDVDRPPLSGQSEPLIHVLDFPPSKMMCGAPVVIGEPCVRWRHAEHATCEECKREAASR